MKAAFLKSQKNTAWIALELCHARLSSNCTQAIWAVKLYRGPLPSPQNWQISSGHHFICSLTFCYAIRCLEPASPLHCELTHVARVCAGRFSCQSSLVCRWRRQAAGEHRAGERSPRLGRLCTAAAPLSATSLSSCTRVAILSR